MASYEEIAKQFEELGTEPSNEVLDKAYELCCIYNIKDAVEFVEQWMAFSISNLHGEEPTVEFLSEMERKELAHRKDEYSLSKKQKHKRTIGLSNQSDVNSPKIYGSTGYTEPADHSDSYTLNEDDSVLCSYISNTPKVKKTAIKSRLDNSALLPTGYSPLSKTPRSQSENAGKVVCTFGNPKLVQDAVWCSEEYQKLPVKIVSVHDGEPMSATCKYMYNNLSEQCSVQVDRLFDIGKQLCQKVFGADASEYDLINVDTPSQDEVKTVGRIASDFDGRLDPASVILIGSDEMKCRTVRLNFSQTKSFGVFPGEIVMVSGANPTGTVFYVDEVLANRNLEPPKLPSIEKPIRLVVAAGPYTSDDDIVYEPLHDLLAYCKSNKPDVVVLCGPFMDEDHTQLQGNVLTESHEMFFEKMLTDIVDSIGNETLICIVSCYKDVISSCVFPTHPIVVKKSFPNVIFLPDPCTIDINGLTIALTSIDIVDQILEEELAVNAGDKYKRCVNYLFNQGTFYPLNPPSLNISVDSELLTNYGRLDAIPNVIVVPSNQRYFVRDVQNCLAINPGRVATKSGGTFCRLIVHPPNENTNLISNIACQVLRV